jgi:hypothetical protein
MGLLFGSCDGVLSWLHNNWCDVRCRTVLEGSVTDLGAAMTHLKSIALSVLALVLVLPLMLVLALGHGLWQIKFSFHPKRTNDFR